jgi:hypothetical protein
MVRFVRDSAGIAWLLLMMSAASHTDAQTSPANEHFDFSRMVVHWAEYDHEDYLPFLDEAKPEVAQVGFYGAHFWGLAHTPHGGGYPAHFPMQGHRECGDWFEDLNRKIQKRGIKIIGHLNVTFLVGDPDSEEGPRGFFDFYRKRWDEKILGPKPVEDPADFLQRNRDGSPIIESNYTIGGMKEYWACLRNPHWRQVLKAWVRAGIARGIDGYIVTYFYRKDCHCVHCVSGFKDYLANRFTKEQLRELFAIENLEEHMFEEIVSWHSPDSSTPLRREGLRFSQITNQEAFEEVFVEFGRSLKPNLIVAQWNHIGDFGQIDSDERGFLPANMWAPHEDYTWYSTGGAANFTKLKKGVLGEGTLQARYIRGAMRGRPFTLGKYEAVRIRAAIAELAANGGAPMGFDIRFTNPEARSVFTRYYGFLHRHDRLYRGNRTSGEVLLLYPRRRVHAGDVSAVDRFKEIGRRLLDDHVAFDVLPDVAFAEMFEPKYATVLDPSDALLAADNVTQRLPQDLSRFAAPKTVRVSISRPAELNELTVHFVNYNREERGDGGNPNGDISHEKPIPTDSFTAEILLPEGFSVERLEFLTPEADQAAPLDYQVSAQRLKCRVPPFLVYGVLRIRLTEIGIAPPERKVAAIVTEYGHNSHADIIVSRLLQTDTLDGKGIDSPLKLVSLYTDQVPERDTSRMLAASHRFRLSDTIEDALTLGTGKLAVDGVLMIAEHGDYPRSKTTNIQYPKRRFWEEILNVFRDSGRIVPVFVDKHLADNWEDAKFIFDTARELNVPLMAGSSLPLTWRRPAADVPRGAALREIVAISFHTTDAYGFHALEFAQALAEQRHGGETGIRAVQAFAGEAVWREFDDRALDVELFNAAWERLSHTAVPLDNLRERVKNPRLLRMEYMDGLRVHVVELNEIVYEWSGAWRYEDGSSLSSLFWTQEARPGMHFTYLLNGIERMMLTGKASWNAERTLLTSGALDALLISLTENQRRVETPYLEINYQPSWRWKEPAFPPPMRPWAEQ